MLKNKGGHMLKNTGVLLTVVGVVAITACTASTRITSSWTEPSSGSIEFTKTLVVFMSPNQGIRRTAEDQLVSLMTGSEAVASYTMFPGDTGRDEARAMAAIIDAGYDGAVVMRMISEDQELTYTPGMSYPSHYGSFGGYYGHGWGAAYDPGYLRTDTIVKVETTVYSIRDDKLVWSGVSETFNPNNAENLVDDVARAVVRELEREGLIG